MASLSFSCPLLYHRCQLIYSPTFPMSNMLQLKNLRLQGFNVQVISKKSTSDDLENVSDEKPAGKTSKKTQRAPRRSRKKTDAKTLEAKTTKTVSSIKEEETSIAPALAADSKEVTRRGRKKASTLPSSDDESIEKKPIKRRTRKKKDPEKDLIINGESSDLEESISPNALENEAEEKKPVKRRTRKKKVPEKDLHINGESSDLEESISPNALENETEEMQLRVDEGEDISFTYSWPPLVCCFGAAQYGFIPSGRPANRLIDHEYHESNKDMFWSPTKFVRAPGSSSSSVALALASIGGQVAFMGKVGDDEYGQNLLYHLNVNNVQTRSVVIDNSRPTAVSQMKITRRGGLRMSCVKPCAEDNFVSSEINIDVLKEAKMFYFNSSSLLDQNMRRTTMQAVKASKKLEGVIFFDLNLPLPLWESSEETMSFIKQAWDSADIIEVTKQELEFLLGIQPNETFDTNDNDRSKYVHHKHEVVKTLWHDNLKVLFVTNGTSKIHYYTQKESGSVHGMEDAPITPFTGDMSISGDAVVAALMRMLTVQPHLTTDKSYLEHSIKYAIGCGVIDQWLLARVRGFPPKKGMDLEAFSSSSSEYEFSTMRSITEKEYRTVERTVDHPVEELVEADITNH